MQIAGHIVAFFLPLTPCFFLGIIMLDAGDEEGDRLEAVCKGLIIIFGLLAITIQTGSSYGAAAVAGAITGTIIGIKS